MHGHVSALSSDEALACMHGTASGVLKVVYCGRAVGQDITQPVVSMVDRDSCQALCEYRLEEQPPDALAAHSSIHHVPRLLQLVRMHACPGACSSGRLW